MASDIIDYETLDSLLDDLDVKSQQKQRDEADDAYRVYQRRHPRHPFRVRCTIHFLTGRLLSEVSVLPGRTRNLSRSGVALLVRRVFAKGEPIEVEIAVRGRPRTYMAGLVTFCRYAGRSYHELGVELKATSPEPIFSREPLLAIRTLEWLRPESETH